MRNPDQGVRPKYLDLRQIKLPITGIVSIAHRISGVILVISIPAWLYLLEMSVTSEKGYQQVLEKTDGFLFSLMAIVCLWALVHHFFAGIRFLLFDLDIAVDKVSAHKMAKLVFALEIIVMLPIIGWLL